jgi:hypothetical protein
MSQPPILLLQAHFRASYQFFVLRRNSLYALGQKNCYLAPEMSFRNLEENGGLAQ